jgi:hypothetical protein
MKLAMQVHVLYYIIIRPTLCSAVGIATSYGLDGRGGVGFESR